jgi:hypothetical protein
VRDRRWADFRGLMGVVILLCLLRRLRSISTLTCHPLPKPYSLKPWTENGGISVPPPQVGRGHGMSCSSGRRSIRRRRGLTPPPWNRSWSRSTTTGTSRFQRFPGATSSGSAAKLPRRSAPADDSSWTASKRWNVHSCERPARTFGFSKSNLQGGNDPCSLRYGKTLRRGLPAVRT